MLSGLKEGGTFLLNCVWKPEELMRNSWLHEEIHCQNKINFYTINAVDIARELGLGNCQHDYAICLSTGQRNSWKKPLMN